MPKKRILVIGDLILDAYYHGRYLGLSVSDGKTRVGLAGSSRYTWGGAGLLVRNILALGGTVSFISLLGKDGFTSRASEFTHPRLKKIFLQVPSRPTTVKERFWIDKRNSFEWHHFDNSPLPKPLQKKIMNAFRKELRLAEKVIIADYRHGLLSPALAREIIRTCAGSGVPLYIDSQIAYNEGNHHWYKGAYLICLNRGEAESADRRFDVRQLRQSLARLRNILQTQNIVVKLGERGSAALIEGEYVEARAHKVTSADTTGAGDAFLGCLATASAPPTLRDLRRANIWAALSTTMIGTEIPEVKKFRTLIAREKNLD